MLQISYEEKDKYKRKHINHINAANDSSQGKSITEVRRTVEFTLKTETRRNATKPENPMCIIVSVIGKGNLKYFGERTHCKYKIELDTNIVLL